MMARLNNRPLVLDLAHRKGTEKDTVLLADAIMQTGYNYATKAGISINVKDMTIPDEGLRFKNGCFVKFTVGKCESITTFQA